jgi:hypothetical protein
MPGTISRALPLAGALLALAACSSNTTSNTAGGGSSATGSANSAPYRAVCKAEDKAHADASYILDGNVTARKAYDVLQDYKDAINASITDAIEGSNLWNDLTTETLKLTDLAADSDISADVARGALQEFDTARAAVVADCQSYGYDYSSPTG